MRVEISPQRASVVPGQPLVMSVQVFNSADVISAYRVRVLGVDDRWVTISTDQLSLFPETTGVTVLTITLPPGIPAGTRRVGIQVRELTPPSRTQVVEAELTVPEELDLRIQLDPVSVTGGKSATIGVLVENSGNTEMAVRLAGADEEAKVDFSFAPPVISLAPGERVSATAKLRAKRRLVGTPKVRAFTVRSDGSSAPTQAFGTFVQKPLLTRGALSLLGLLAAVTIFAVVITTSLSRVVNKSASDRDLVLQVVQGGQGGGGAAPGSIAGTVTLLTSGSGVSGVTVEAFDAGNTAQAITSNATDAGGGYTVGGLAAGTYKLRFRGAGFSELWFPQSLTPDNAKAIELTQGQSATGIDVRLGGIPAKLTGKVVADDPTGATVSLELPAPAATGPAIAAAAGPGTVNEGPIVQTTTVDASGAFVLDQVPSPSTYQLVVKKQGFATEVQQVDVGGGEVRDGIEIRLRKGDGSISGHISNADGPIGGATITASDGHTTITTVSLTQDDLGAFNLRNLPTPANYTVVVTKPGFSPQTLTLTLASAQQLSGVAVALGGGAGSISGKVTFTDGTPAGGVTVKVTNGDITVQSVTLSVGAVGTYKVDGLTVPSTYTVTFSRPDLADQTRALDLDALGTKDATGIDASMVSATASLFGTISELGGGPLGEIDVVLTSGNTTFRTRSASVPTPGRYEIDNIGPGTYSVSFNRRGASPTSSIIAFTAGQKREFNPVLAKAASITGLVQHDTGDGKQPLPGAEIRLYLANQYPNARLATVITGSDGRFTFSNLDAPQSYIVEYAYPQGTPGQKTVQVTTQASQGVTLDPVTLATG
ncbi:MAG: hypothetical protein QOG64_351 [Acidimicrobiaceae bacterium]|nr:hypothetical protein [Acidimicrobiaceae bacterium]